MKRLTLKPGPELIARWGNPDATSAEDAWLEGPVTEKAHEWLDEPVELDPGVTLADLMGLVRRSPLLKIIYRRFYAAEMSEEATLGPQPFDSALPEDAVEYLDLRQYWSFDSATRTYEPLHRLTLNGIGIVQTQDRPDMGVQAGERIRWGVNSSALRSLLALPLRVNPEVVVSEAGDPGYGQDLSTALHLHVTLGQVLHSVLWDLSFFGPPEKQAKFVAELARLGRAFDAANDDSIRP